MNDLKELKLYFNESDFGLTYREFYRKNFNDEF